MTPQEYERERDAALAVIRDIRALGIELRAGEGESAGKVLFRPKGAMPFDVHSRLVDHKPAVLTLLAREDAELAWRIAAFRQQIPTGNAPILPLYARESAKGPRQPRRCGSCGDALTAGRVYVCEPCQRASWLALGMSEPAAMRPGRPEGRAS